MFARFSQSPTLRTAVSAIVALLGYGIWAYAVNSQFGTDAAQRAALTQGLYSFCITLLLTGLMEFVYTRLSARSQQARFWLTSLPVCLLLYLTSWSVNWLAGTPNIVLTILPGAIISTVYTLGYVAALGKLSKYSAS